MGRPLWSIVRVEATCKAGRMCQCCCPFSKREGAGVRSGSLRLPINEGVLSVTLCLSGGRQGRLPQMPVGDALVGVAEAQQRRVAEMAGYQLHADG